MPEKHGIIGHIMQKLKRLGYIYNAIMHALAEIIYREMRKQ